MTRRSTPRSWPGARLRAREARRADAQRSRRARTRAIRVRVAGLVLEHGGDARQVAVGLAARRDRGLRRLRRGAARSASAPRWRARCARSPTCSTATRRAEVALAERKTRFVARLAGVGARARLGRRLRQARQPAAIVADLEAEGLATLGRFSGKPRQIRWYYEEVERGAGRRPAAAPARRARRPPRDASPLRARSVAGALMRRRLLVARRRLLARVRRACRVSSTAAQSHRGAAAGRALAARGRALRDAARGGPPRGPAALGPRPREAERPRSGGRAAPDRGQRRAPGVRPGDAEPGRPELRAQRGRRLRHDHAARSAPALAARDLDEPAGARASTRPRSSTPSRRAPAAGSRVIRSGADLERFLAARAQRPGARRRACSASKARRRSTASSPAWTRSSRRACA